MPKPSEQPFSEPPADSDASEDTITYNNLVRRAGFSAIAAFRLAMAELAADRGPSKIMAGTLKDRIGAALVTCKEILGVKKMFRNEQTHKNEKGCRDLEKLLIDMNEASREVFNRATRAGPTDVSPRQAHDGLAADLGDNYMNVLTDILHRSFAWAQENHKSYAEFWDIGEPTS